MPSHDDDKTTQPGLRGDAGESLLWVRDLVKSFQIRSSAGFWRHEQLALRAVDHVSFDIKAGETFGLVGESGCGKSTLARCILRLLESDSGDIIFDGADLRTLSRDDMRAYRRRMQIVFQDPYASLDPRMSIGETVEEPLRVHGIGDQTEREARVDEVLSLVGITGDQRTRKPHAFSGGQRQRIGIARALILYPELVVLDEPVSALDVSIQAQVLNLLRDLQQRLNLTYLFIVHDLAIAEYFCDRLAVLYLGAVMEMADRETLFHNPLHPYTVALLSAVPTPDPAAGRRGKRIALSGEVNPLSTREGGCRFRSRCPIGKDRPLCRAEEPPLTQLQPGHWVSCHYPGELAPR
ncbi:MAG: ABC transporter ATP-binding protein [Anaerolineae bacterium]|nr:ABC transporter ATP-binding protein [Anaerolineae bacterium]